MREAPTDNNMSEGAFCVRNFHKSANDSHSVKWFKVTSILLQPDIM